MSYASDQYIEQIINRMTDAECAEIDRQCAADDDWKRYDHADYDALADYYDELAAVPSDDDIPL